MSTDGQLPPGVTDRDIAERFGDAPLETCEECGLAFAPLYDGDRICSECRKTIAKDE